MKIDGTGIPPASRAENPEKPVRGRSSEVTSGSAGVPADGVELSALSQALATLATMNDIREELVATVLAQLESGEYLDGDKLQEAVLRMLSE